MPAPFHEGQALDAAIRVIEKREGASRSNGRDPERDKHDAPIDYACEIAGKLYAFEHTGVEAYPGQLKSSAEAEKLFLPVLEKLTPIVPENEYATLSVPIDATSGLKNNQTAGVAAAIEEWIAAAFAHIEPLRFPDMPRPYKTATLNDVPFEIALHRYHSVGPLGGKFSLRRIIAGNREAERMARLEIASQKKNGKLAQWKRDAAAVSILVLEVVDISLTNETLVAEALRAAESGMSDLPDEVYIVNACSDPWYVSCLRRPDKTFYDDDERYHEVARASLETLTPR